MTFRLLSAGIVLAIGLVGCGTDPVDCGTPPDLGGTWTVTGGRSSPSPATLTGTLTLNANGGCPIEGSYSLAQDDGSEPPELFDGQVSGTFLDDSTLDISLIEDSDQTERRLLAVVTADTIAGTWSILGAGSQSGTLRAERETP